MVEKNNYFPGLILYTLIMIEKYRNNSFIKSLKYVDSLYYY